MQIVPEIVKSEVQMLLALKSIVTDLTALKTAVNGLNDAADALKLDHNTLRAKLNLDGGVTDTDYAASTSTTPADVTLSTS